jgi:hypothetical protein
MDGPKLFQFVDVELHGAWTEGLVVGMEDSGLRVQVDSTLVLTTSVVRPFRSQTQANCSITRMRLYVLDLERELEEWVMTKKYWQSDELFVQFFAGILPYLYSPESIRREENTNSRSARAVLDFYKTAQQRTFQPTESPGSLTWERQVPVLCALLRDNDLLLPLRKELFFAYAAALASLCFPQSWLSTCGQPLRCLTPTFHPGARSGLPAPLCSVAQDRGNSANAIIPASIQVLS